MKITKSTPAFLAGLLLFRRIFISPLGVAVFLLPSVLHGQETWTFDPTFQRTPLRQTSENASGVKVLNSGKVLVHTINGALMSGANGSRIGALLRIDPNTGAIDPTWNPDPTVTAGGFLGVAEAPDGKIYYSTALVGELANNSTDPAVRRLIRLNTDGSRDTSFNSPIFGYGTRFLGVQPDGKIIVCSDQFNQIGVPPPGSITQTVRLNTDGTLDTSFQSPIFTVNAASAPTGVSGPPVIDSTTGKIYFCGAFLLVNGQARKGIVRCNADGTVDSSFVPTGLSSNTSTIGGRAMVLQTGGKVVLGGPNMRTAAGGNTTYMLLRFNTNGALDPTFTLVPTTTSNSGPRDIHTLPGGNILTVYTQVLRFLPDGAVDSSFTPLDYSSPYVGGFVSATRFDVNPNTGAAYLTNPGPLYARLGGVPVGNITKLTSGGTIDTQFNSPVVESEDFAPDVQISAVGAVYVSGFHTDFGNAANATITRLLANGTRDPSYSLDTLPFADKQAVEFALLPNGAAYVIYASGSFNGGYAFSNLARLLPTGALDTSFRPSSALQTSLGVNAFDGNDLFRTRAPSISAAPNGGAYVFSGADFYGTEEQATVNANGNLKPTRINSDGTEDTSVPALGFPVGEVTRDASGITGGSTGYLHRLAQTADGGFIILASVAPFPSSTTGAPYNYKVIKVQADGSRDTNFNSPSLTSTAAAIQNFPFNLVDPLTGNTFFPINGFYREPGHPVSSAAMLPDGSVLLPGNFQLTGDPTTYLLAKLTPAGALDTSFTPPVPQNTAQPNRPAVISNVRVGLDGKIWLLGRFDTIGGNPAPGVARLNPGGTLDTTFQLTGVGFYDSFGDDADVVFANSNTAYLVGTFRRPGEPIPSAVTRIVGPSIIPTPTPSGTPTPTPSGTPTPTPSGTPTPTPTATPPSTPSKLLNIATRLRVLTGNNVMIGGFIITGTAPKRLIVRASGPLLANFGVSGALADPVLELHGPGGFITITNDNWRDTQQQEIEDTGIPPSFTLESAIVATLPPGAYTAIVRGQGGGTGVGLVEAYDLDSASNSQLANISTRGFVDTGDNVMIGGLIAGPAGTGGGSMLVRAIGPSLANFGVQGAQGALQDPSLELRDGNGGLLAFNDDWRDTQQTAIEATQLAPGHVKEAAILAPLAPGLYTAIVRGVGNTTGVGLVEVYNLN